MSGGCSLVLVHRLFTAVASLVADTCLVALQYLGSSRPGVEPALAGEFLTTMEVWLPTNLIKKKRKSNILHDWASNRISLSCSILPFVFRHIGRPSAPGTSRVFFFLWAFSCDVCTLWLWVPFSAVGLFYLAVELSSNFASSKESSLKPPEFQPLSVHASFVSLFL